MDMPWDQMNDKTAILEPQECFNKAVVGIQDQRLVYSYKKIVLALVEYYNFSIDGAYSWIEYNTIRSLPYMGPYKPIILDDDGDKHA